MDIGNIIKLNVFGESHSVQIGCEINGLPQGITINADALNTFMQRRAPGRNAWSTPRKEPDVPQFTEGVDFDDNGNFTINGSRVKAIIVNTNIRPQDYGNTRFVPRPGHADYTAYVKYGAENFTSGGGRFSGRMTAPVCIAGGICKQILESKGIRIDAHIASIGNIEDTAFNPLDPTGQAGQIDYLGFPVISQEQGVKMQALIEECRMDQDSIGGTIECAITGLEAGYGGALFDGIEGQLSQALFGIPAVKGVEFGAGFAVSRMRGSQNNDPFAFENGRVVTATNNHGGILGGISSGMPIIFRIAVKPTPSISRTQQSVDLQAGESAELTVNGRHDPCIVPRAVAVVEAVASLVTLDLILQGK